MHIVVCLKQVVDPEIPPQQFKVDRDAKIQVRGDLPLVMGNFDGCALELGLQLKAAVNGRVTALSLGPATARDMLKSALAMGADDALLLSDPAFEGGDSFATARALVAAIRKLPPADVILCGRQASDYEVGQVGGCLAEALGFPLVSLARQLGVVVGGGGFPRAARPTGGTRSSRSSRPPSSRSRTTTTTSPAWPRYAACYRRGGGRSRRGGSPSSASRRTRWGGPPRARRWWRWTFSRSPRSAR